MWLRLLPFAGWPLAAMMFWFWLGAKEDIAAEIERCNSDKLTSIAEAERITRETIETASAQRVAQLERMANNERDARQIAENAAEAARAGQVEQAGRIRTLELEADVDDIPDSNDCLIVFVPRRVLPAEDCGETSSGGSGSGGNCIGAEGPDPTASPFSNITFADSLRLWSRDRAIIRGLNGQLEAIESLGETE